MPRKHPLSFEDEARKAGVISTVPLGTQPILVKRIVGSAGKADWVGPDFLPLGAGPASGNYRDILLRMQQGEVLPPISVYQLGHRYFVIDGHTRVAAAKQLGIDFLDANVTQALPRKEGAANLTFYAGQKFAQATGLQEIRLTAPWRYELLQHHIEGYRIYLNLSRDRDVSLPEAARIWFRTQYTPTLLEIRRRRLTSRTRTAGDVYTDILRAWADEDAFGISLREMLDRYDQELRPDRGRLERARRLATDVVDAALPKAVPPVTRPRPDRFAAEDVDAEMEGLLQADEPTETPTS